jgi:phosphatidate cytidylyltransferase
MIQLKRWITGLVALPFIILLIFFGGPFLFFLLVYVVGLLALWEYFRIVYNPQDQLASDPARSSNLNRQNSSVPIFQVLAFITGTLIMWSAYKNAFEMILGFIALTLILSGLISLVQFKSNPFVFERATQQILGIIYIPVLLSYVVLIRNGINGADWIFSVLFIVFAGDTSAYYAGSYLGRHKLCPSVSPNKTIEGALGGLAASLCMGAILKNFFLAKSPWGLSILLFLVIGVAGQVGDLFESVIKRSANVKDSGGILPGHGGMLDRIDALLFVAPVTYFFKEYIL